MKQLTYDEYDELCASFENAGFSPQLLPYFPDAAALTVLASDIEKYYDFLIFLDCQNPLPTTDEEKESARAIAELIKNNIEFID